MMAVRRLNRANFMSAFVEVYALPQNLNTCKPSETHLFVVSKELKDNAQQEVLMVVKALGVDLRPLALFLMLGSWYPHSIIVANDVIAKSPPIGVSNTHGDIDSETISRIE